MRSAQFIRYGLKHMANQKSAAFAGPFVNL